MQQILTSISHPLRIDYVVIPETGGRIGMTLCPGKCSPSYYGYTWQRDLDLDMQKVKAWGADTLVTLMETDELRSCQVDTIGEICNQNGIEWHHLPIPDVDIPKATFENRWSYSGVRIRNQLREGNRVLLHCRGGLGRTGIIAAQLLVELGMDPGTAIEKIRNKRPGTIETAAQETYARSSFPVEEHESERLSRLMGCLFGGAIGDGLGYLVEFDSINEIRRNYGQQGVSDPVHNDIITVSDDTQMTLFTMEGMLRAQAKDCSPDTTIAEVRNAYLDWYSTQCHELRRETILGSLALSPALQACRAPGNTCLGALEAGGNGTPDKPINDSKGCGSVMRVAPVGLVADSLDERQVFELGMRTGALTHGHMTSSLSAGAMACMISNLLAGEDLKTVAHSTLELLKEYPDHGETSLAISKALETAKNTTGGYPTVINSLWGDPRLKDGVSRGWIAEEALAIGLYGALRGENYPEVIQIAANHNGDSDSTASVAGQLYGAWKGVDTIPHNWITKLDVFEEIVNLLAAAANFSSYTRRKS